MEQENKTIKPENLDLQGSQKILETNINDFLPLAICSLDSSGVIAGVNRVFQLMTGYGAAGALGARLEKFFQDKNRISNLLAEAKKNNRAEARSLILAAREKKEVPLSVSIAATKDASGNFSGYLAAFSDISEQKRLKEEMDQRVEEKTKELEHLRIALMNILEDVEEARQKTEDEKNKTLAIINNFTDGLLVFDDKNILTLINPQAQTMFGVNSKEIIGKTTKELEKTASLEPAMKMLSKGGKEVYREEIAIKESTTVEVSAIPIVGWDGKVNTLLIIHDITREKMVERIKTEFVSISAHQLRTPLSAIKWTLRMILDGDLGEISKEQKEFLERTYASNERMISLINDLLDVTRIEEGRYIYKLIPTDMHALVESLVNSYKEVSEKKKIKIDLKKPDGQLPKVMTDEEKIRLSIQNLIDNALRYTPSGGQVTVWAEKKRGEVTIAVKDTGVGIPKDQQARLFSKFFRGANVVRMDTEGTGLGLFITKNIVEAHGGKISFESEEGKGTTFYISLPVKE